jgi:hypothetical protein
MLDISSRLDKTPSMANFTINGASAPFGSIPSPGLIDTGEVLISTRGQSNFYLAEFELSNASGVALCVEESPYMDMATCIRDFNIHDSYIGIGTRNKGEYATIQGGIVHHCLFGLHCASGNNKVLGTNFLHNKYGIFLYKGDNHAHGVMQGVTSNHNEFNVICWDVSIGQVFSGGCFFGGFAGGNGKMDFQRSKGILFSGAHIGSSDVAIDATSKVAFRGVLWQGNVNITVAPGGVLDAKNCVVVDGANLTLNGQPWPGNT